LYVGNQHLIASSLPLLEFSGTGFILLNFGLKGFQPGLSGNS